MGEAKAYAAILLFICSITLALMGIHYLGVVKPEWLVPNIFLDALAPPSFENSTAIRGFFIFVMLIVSLVSPGSSKLGDELARNQKLKVLTVFFLLLSIYLLLSIEKFPFLMFATLYPVSLLMFVSSSFIIANLLKFKKEKFDVEFGFKPTWKKYPNPKLQSFHLYSKQYGWLNVENIYRGLYLLGSAGSGKSFSCIEPFIEQCIRQGMTGLIFDFKMSPNFINDPSKWALTRYAYMMFLKYIQHPAQVDANGKFIGPHSPTNDRRKFWIVNFKDPRYSHRINPIAPQYLETPGYVNEYAMALLTNLEPKWLRERDFFANSAIGYLKAIIWFLRCDYPELCTLPHAITIALQPYNKVLAALSLNPECVEMLGSLAVADEKNAEGQLAGVDASLKIPMDKINSPEIFWVLSGNDFSLVLNSPENPGVLCLGSDQELQDTYSPICALIATVVRKVINYPGRLPSFYILDECPQLNIPNLDDLPATGRSNLISVFVAGQTYSQFVKNYGKERADSISANLGTHIYGQLSNETEAQIVSKLIGQREKITHSYSESSGKGDQGKSSSENTNLTKESLIHPHEIVTLPQGVFVGKVAQVTMKDGKQAYEPFFKIKPDIDKPFIEHEFPMIVRHPEDSKELTFDEMMKIMWDNARKIKFEAALIIDRSARTACMAGKADEEKVFPKHFQRIGNELVRVVSTTGKVMPGIEGITVTGEFHEVSGKARRSSQGSMTDDMIDVVTTKSGRTRIS